MSTIYEPKGRAREYSPLALNYFTGCDHGCKYCYVTPMMKRFNRNFKHGVSVINVNYKKIEASAKKMAGVGKQVLFSFTSDPYTCLENGETRTVLEILNKYDHKVSILTKSGSKTLRDIDIFKKYGSRIKIGATLTFDNANDSIEWEPKAALPDDRIKALRDLSEEGIITWASFEPVIIPDQSLNLLSQISEFIDHIKIGKINNYKGLDKKINWSDFICNAVNICRHKNVSFYIKKDLLLHKPIDIYLLDCETNKDFLNL